MKRGIIADRRHRFLASMAVGVAACGSAFAQNNGRYLPNTANLNNVNGFSWIAPNTAEEFNADIECDGRLLGRAQFTFDMWRGTSSLSGRPTGGAALAGGFFINTNQVPAPGGGMGTVTVCAGWQMRWVQIVRTTLNGATEWGVPNLTWFPDTANGRTSPAYPGQALPGNTVAPNPPPNPGYQDFPARFPHQGNQTFQAELALCALNTTGGTNTCCILGSFTWGYDVTMTPPAFTRQALGQWTPGGSANLSTVLTDAFDGNGLSNNPANSTQWSIGSGDCCEMVFCITPSPGAAGLLGLGLAAAAGRRR